MPSNSLLLNLGVVPKSLSPGSLEWLTEVKNGSIIYIFDLMSHVIAKCGNVSNEIAGRQQNNSVILYIAWAL